MVASNRIFIEKSAMLSPQPPSQLWSKSFRELFCDAFHCPTDQFEKTIFQRCLHRHAVPFARLLESQGPGFFKEDYDLIREIAEIRDNQTFRAELNRFYGRNVRDKSWLRGTFSIRLSAKRLLRLKNRALAKAG
jgi:hypothetical protein